MRGMVYLCGGRDDKGVTSKEVFAFSVTDGTWAEKREPDLNIGRIDHGVCVQGDRIFVICGYSYSHGFLDSIEMLDLSVERKRSFLGGESGRVWKLFTVGPLTPRQNPSVAPLGNSKILVMGGYHEERFPNGNEGTEEEKAATTFQSISYLSDAVIIDVNDCVKEEPQLACNINPNELEAFLAISGTPFSF